MAIYRTHRSDTYVLLDRSTPLCSWVLHGWLTPLCLEGQMIQLWSLGLLSYTHHAHRLTSYIQSFRVPSYCAPLVPNILLSANTGRQIKLEV